MSGSTNPPPVNVTPPAGNTSSPPSNPDIPETRQASELGGPQVGVAQTETGTTVSDVLKESVLTRTMIPAAGSMGAAPGGVGEAVPVDGMLPPLLFADIDPALVGRLYPNAGISGNLRDLAFEQGQATAKASAALMKEQREAEKGNVDSSGNPRPVAPPPGAEGTAAPSGVLYPNDPGTRPPYSAPNPTIPGGQSSTTGGQSTVTGGSGNDTVTGGQGNDTQSGGADTQPGGTA